MLLLRSGIIALAFCSWSCATSQVRTPASGAPSSDACAPMPVHPRFEINTDTKSCVETSLLIQTLATSLEFFEAEFGPVEGNFRINIGEGLKVGYSPKADVINFASSTKVIDSGLRSVDVQSHEFFHNLTCRKYERLCDQSKLSQENDELEIILESLADYFSYIQNPDECFGDNYYAANKCIRSFKNDFEFHLVEGSHVQGSVVTSLLINEGVQLSLVRKFFESGDYSLKNLIPKKWHKKVGLRDPVQLSLSGEKIFIHRGNAIADLKWDVPGVIRFIPNKEFIRRYPDAKAELVHDPEDREKISPVVLQQTNSQTAFEFTVTPVETGRQKYFLELKSNDKLIGRLRLFFRVKN